MDLDNIFDRRENKHHDGRDQHSRHHDEFYDRHHSTHSNKRSYEYDDRESHFDIQRQILDKLKSNPKLKIMLIVAVVVVLGVAIIVIIALLPFIQKLTSIFYNSGIKGLLDAVWTGAK